MSDTCTPWKWDGLQYVRNCKDSCGRGMIQYADAEAAKYYPQEVKQRGYGDSCEQSALQQLDFGFKPSQPAAPPPPLTHTSYAPYQIDPNMGFGPVPDGCTLFGVRHGKRYILCPDKKGRLKKMLGGLSGQLHGLGCSPGSNCCSKCRGGVHGLGDPVPSSSGVEPFVWLGLTALGLYAVTRKKK